MLSRNYNLKSSAWFQTQDDLLFAGVDLNSSRSLLEDHLRCDVRTRGGFEEVPA